ncbi:ATP-binding cassette domain-containing protein, partial [Acinetobacter baumannii]
MLIACRFELQMGQFHIEANFQSDASVIGLFGVSGSGKTSILHAIAGLNTPRSGLIKIQDQTWFDSNQKINVSTQKRHVGLVFQDA